MLYKLKKKDIETINQHVFRGWLAFMRPQFNHTNNT